MATKITPQRTILLPRTEHKRLLAIEAAYERLQNVFFAHSFVKPSTQNPDAVLKELRKTKKYSPAFLKSLKTGLKESRFFKESA